MRCIEAGKEFDIRPFGVETQRLLRLEKGHIIVSQDTDGMSHPGELDRWSWAISRKKPFFVGRRSVDIVMAQPQTRKLVGFTLPKGYHVNRKRVIWSSTVRRYQRQRDLLRVLACGRCAIIGLAYVGIAQSRGGRPASRSVSTVVKSCKAEGGRAAILRSG